MQNLLTFAGSFSPLEKLDSRSSTPALLTLTRDAILRTIKRLETWYWRWRCFFLIRVELPQGETKPTESGTRPAPSVLFHRLVAYLVDEKDTPNSQLQVFLGFQRTQDDPPYSTTTNATGKVIVG